MPKNAARTPSRLHALLGMDLKTHRSVVVNLHADHKPDFVTQARRQGIQTTIASPPKFLNFK
jgi:hypothetical protein